MITPGASSIKATGDMAGLSPQVVVKELEDGAQPHPTLALATLSLLAQLGEAFCQQRTALRAWRMAVGQALTLGSRTISRIIASLQRDQRDWSADYRLFSRSPWHTRALFVPVLREALSAALPPHVAPDAPIWVAGDHTHLRKTGRHIAGAHTIRDPMSPPWHVNLIRGLLQDLFQSPHAGHRTVMPLSERCRALHQSGTGGGSTLLQPQEIHARCPAPG